MISFMILLFCIISLAIDVYIFMRFFRRKRTLPLRVLYIALSATTHLSVLAMAIFYKHLIDDVAMMSVVTWIIFFFMMSYLSRLIFTIFSLLQLGLHKIFSRHTFRGFTYVGIVGSLGLVALMGYGNIIGRSDIRVERVEIVSSKLPPAFDGYRIAQFSDTHLGNWGSNTSVIGAMVDTINSLHPDIVVQSGDLVNVVSTELSPKFMDIFRQIKAPVYSVLGNHDLGFYVFDTLKNNPGAIVADLISKQRSMGWTMMENENRWLYRGADSILLAGVSYPNNISHNGYNSKNGGSDLARAMRGATDDQFSVLISHSPKLFDSVPSIARPNLTLSGHVHAMQAKITFGGWRFSPASWLYPLYSGLYEDRGRYLYVNDGIGYVLYPMRIGAKPEVTLFTLRTK